MKEPRRYGFVYTPQDLYQPQTIRTVGLDTAITNLSRFAQQMKIDYNQLKLHNPWLMQNHLNNKSRKHYEIGIPIAGE